MIRQSLRLNRIAATCSATLETGKIDTRRLPAALRTAAARTDGWLRHTWIIGHLLHPFDVVVCATGSNT